jgi:hypothetical protein
MIVGRGCYLGVSGFLLPPRPCYEIRKGAGGGETNFSNFRCRLEDENIVTSEEDGNCGSKAAEACSHDDDLVGVT